MEKSTQSRENGVEDPLTLYKKGGIMVIMENV